MNIRLHEEIVTLEKEGWKLCAGCIHSMDDDCKDCGIEKRKRMGIPPNKGETCQK